MILIKKIMGSCRSPAPNPPTKGNPGFGASRAHVTPDFFESGQALVTLLIFLMMGIAIATAASFIIASNSQATTNIQEGILAREAADSGVETAYLKILRNGTAYTGETVTLGTISTAVNVSWNSITATIDSVATNGNFIKKVESVVTYDNNGLTQVSWKEIN